MATASAGKGRGHLNAWDAVAASATDSVLVAAVANSAIRVNAAFVNQGDTTASTVTFNTKGAGAGTAISPALKGSANGGYVMPDNASGWFQTNIGEGLTVTTGSGSTTGIIVNYTLVPR